MAAVGGVMPLPTKPYRRFERSATLEAMGQAFSQLLPLIGVVIGVVGTVITASLTDRRRWKRDQTTRWDEHRLNAYVEFAAQLKDVFALTCCVTAAYRPGARSFHLDWDAGLALIAEAERERARALEKVLVLSDEATANAAMAWCDAVWDLQVYARSRPDAWDEWGPLRDRMDAARAQFYGAVRGNLGVPQLPEAFSLKLHDAAAVEAVVAREQSSTPTL